MERAVALCLVVHSQKEITGFRTWPYAVARRLLGLLALVVLLSACTPGSDLPPLPETTPEAYRLGPGDVVRVITFGDQELTAEFRVSDSGNVAIPLLGNVRAAGQTTDQLQAAISDQLVAKHLFRDPSVAVEIITYRPIFVLGEVAKPGQFPYQPGMTVLTAVAVAGGFTYRAAVNYAAIERQIDSKPFEGRVSRDMLVRPGDVITIFERRF
jgi:polysaccharide export outer membrane protein